MPKRTISPPQKRKDEVAAEYVKVLNELPANIGQLSIMCVGCAGKKIQTRTTDGINVLCPVCNGSGIMPQVVQGGPWPYHQPYPWQPGGGGTLPSFPLPSQIID